MFTFKKEWLYALAVVACCHTVVGQDAKAKAKQEYNLCMQDLRNCNSEASNNFNKCLDKLKTDYLKDKNAPQITNYDTNRKCYKTYTNDLSVCTKKHHNNCQNLG